MSVGHLGLRFYWGDHFFLIDLNVFFYMSWILIFETIRSIAEFFYNLSFQFVFQFYVLGLII